MKIGAITIGQSPRVDVFPDMEPILGEKTEVLQAGALDGLTREEIANMKPGKEDYVLVSRMNDGSFAKFGESYILPRLQECITKLENQGAALIMFLCGGTFPETFVSKVPLIYPSKLLNGTAKALSGRSNIIVITPDAEQIQQAHDQWDPVVDHLTVFAANPYGSIEEVREAAIKAEKEDADLIVMDCIGFSVAAKRLVAEITGKPVLLCRTVLARAVQELLDIGD